MWLAADSVKHVTTGDGKLIDAEYVSPLAACTCGGAHELALQAFPSVYEKLLHEAHKLIASNSSTISIQPKPHLAMAAVMQQPSFGVWVVQ